MYITDIHPCPEDDPILQELRQIREKILAEAGGDGRRVMEEVRRQQYLSGRDLWGIGPSGKLEVVFKGSGKPSPDYRFGPRLNAPEGSDKNG
jgi:hypothetical protein